MKAFLKLERSRHARSSLLAFRFIAYSSIAYSMLSVLSVCVTLPMLSSFVYHLKRTMHNELAFCKVSAIEIRHEVYLLRSIGKSSRNRTIRGAHISEWAEASSTVESNSRARRVEGSGDSTLDEMDRDVFEEESDDHELERRSVITIERNNATARRSSIRRLVEERIGTSKHKFAKDFPTPGGILGIEREVAKSIVNSKTTKGGRKGKAVTPSTNHCYACCLTGKPGIAGSPGRPGKTGKQGAKGLPGNPGHAPLHPCVPSIPPPCKPCPRGSPGPRGPSGERGDAGAPGVPGRRGRYGEPGLPGPKGPQGPRGKDGKKGAPGSPGTSALSVKLIRGPTGPAGVSAPRGPPGRDGIPGENGNHGAPGHKGPPGPDGKPGKDGRPGSRGAPGLPGRRGERGICPKYCAFDGGIFFEDDKH